MAEFHGILPFPFLMSRQFTGGWVGWEVAKTLVRTLMITTGAHTMAHATLVGHKNVQQAAGKILGPHHLISTPNWCHCSSHDFGGLAKCSPENRPAKHLIH